MTKCNIKTFVATSVLCVFFNGALIYGMNDEPEEKKTTELHFHKTEEEEDENEIPVEKNKIIISDKKKKKTEGIRYLNYKGNFSLCCCFNHCNNYDELKAEYEKQMAQKEYEEKKSQKSKPLNNFNENNKFQHPNNNTEPPIVLTFNKESGSIPVPEN